MSRWQRVKRWIANERPEPVDAMQRRAQSIIRERERMARLTRPLDRIGRWCGDRWAVIAGWGAEVIGAISGIGGWLMACLLARRAEPEDMLAALGAMIHAWLREPRRESAGGSLQVRYGGGGGWPRGWRHAAMDWITRHNPVYDDVELLLRMSEMQAAELANYLRLIPYYGLPSFSANWRIEPGHDPAPADAAAKMIGDECLPHLSRAVSMNGKHPGMLFFDLVPKDDRQLDLALVHIQVRAARDDMGRMLGRMCQIGRDETGTDIEPRNEGDEPSGAEMMWREFYRPAVASEREAGGDG